MRLALLHADVAARSCEDCQKHLFYDRGPGDFGSRVERGGKPVKRPKGNRPPCGWCPKIAPGDEPKPENAQELSEKNIVAFTHYLECKAVGAFPADAIVMRNAALIRAAEDLATRAHEARVGLASVIGIQRVTRG